jgi:hypothetical protein
VNTGTPGLNTGLPAPSGTTGAPGSPTNP